LVMSFDFQSALTEIQEKSDSKIQIETAYKWGSRAVVCYRIYQKTKDLTWLQRAEDYKHEAIEHASLADDDFETLKLVTERLKQESTAVVE
jgi:hypothetical protein